MLPGPWLHGSKWKEIIATRGYKVAGRQSLKSEKNSCLLRKLKNQNTVIIIIIIMMKFISEPNKIETTFFRNTYIRETCPELMVPDGLSKWGLCYLTPILLWTRPYYKKSWNFERVIFITIGHEIYS